MYFSKRSESLSYLAPHEDSINSIGKSDKQNQTRCCPIGRYILLVCLTISLIILSTIAWFVIHEQKIAMNFHGNCSQNTELSKQQLQHSFEGSGNKLDGEKDAIFFQNVSTDTSNSTQSPTSTFTDSAETTGFYFMKQYIENIEHKTSLRIEALERNLTNFAGYVDQVKHTVDQLQTNLNILETTNGNLLDLVQKYFSETKEFTKNTDEEIHNVEQNLTFGFQAFEFDMKETWKNMTSVLEDSRKAIEESLTQQLTERLQGMVKTLETNFSYHIEKIMPKEDNGSYNTTALVLKLHDYVNRSIALVVGSEAVARKKDKLELSKIIFNRTNKEELETRLRRNEQQVRTVQSALSSLKTETTSLQQRISDKADAGWIPFSNGYMYYIINQKTDWYDAQKGCLSKNANLACVGLKHYGFYSYIYENLIKPLGQDVWIGLHDRYNENLWQWIDGHKLKQIESHWMNGQPNNYHNNQDCAEIVAANGKWNDETCTAPTPGSKNYALCEKFNH